MTTQPAPSETDRVLLKIARASGPYRSAILNALDIPTAMQLVAGGLATCGPLDDWFNLTDRGLRRAREVNR